jgi:capsular polysaccharide biosynthesis protein
MTADTSTTPTLEISLVEAVWRYRLMSVLIVLACGLAAVGATQLLFGSVQSTARFAVTDPTNTNSLHMGVVSGTGYATYTSQRAVFAQSASVLKRAADIIAGSNGPRFTLEKMRASVHTAAQPDGGVVEVTASGSTVAIAATKANAIVQSYQELTSQTISGRRTQQLAAINNAEKKVAKDLLSAKGKEAIALQANLTKLQTQESQLLADDDGANDGVQFVDQADPTATVSSKLPQNAVIGLAVGVLIACVASFLRASTPVRLGGSHSSVLGLGTPRRAAENQSAGSAAQIAEAERAAWLAAQAEWANLARQAERAELAERARAAMKAEQVLKEAQSLKSEQTLKSEQALKAEQAEQALKAEQAFKTDQALKAHQALKAERAKQADLALQSELEAPRRAVPAEPETEEWPASAERTSWRDGAAHAGPALGDGDDDQADRLESESDAKSIRTSRLMHYYDAER